MLRVLGALAAAAVFDCAIELVGEVRTDPLIDTRYIAYVASGTECEAASRELSGRGVELGIAFLRRPNLGQLRASSPA